MTRNYYCQFNFSNKKMTILSSKPAQSVVLISLNIEAKSLKKSYSQKIC